MISPQLKAPRVSLWKEEGGRSIHVGYRGVRSKYACYDVKNKDGVNYRFDRLLLTEVWVSLESVISPLNNRSC